MGQLTFPCILPWGELQHEHVTARVPLLQHTAGAWGGAGSLVAITAACCPNSNHNQYQLGCAERRADERISCAVQHAKEGGEGRFQLCSVLFAAIEPGLAHTARHLIDPCAHGTFCCDATHIIL